MNLAKFPHHSFGTLESAENALHLQLLAELGDVSWEAFARTLVEESRTYDPLTVFCLLSVLPFLRSGTRPYTVSPALAEHASYYLLPHLNHTGRPPNAREALRLIHLANLAFVGFTEAETPALNLKDPLQMATAQASLNRDTYRGTRYEFQTAELIGGMQGHFTHWYEANLGITPARAVRLIQDIDQVTHERLLPLLNQANRERIRRRSWLPDWLVAQVKRWPLRQKDGYSSTSTRQTAQEAMLEVLLASLAQVLPVSLNDLRARGRDYSSGEWEALQNLVGMTTAQAAVMVSPREAKRKPVKVLPDNRVVCLGAAFVLDELHEALDQAIRPSKVSDKYASWKGEWTEDKAGHLLQQVFGDQVLAGVDYPDPDASHKGTAEVDLLVWSGPYVVFIEVKARGFSAFNETGPVQASRLRSDVQKNYGAAARQADRASRYLQQGGERRFVARRSQREFRVSEGQTLTPLALSVSLYHLAGLVQQAQGLGNAHVPLTPSVALADLELICEFCDGPDVLIAYLIVRQQLLALQEKLQTHEPDLFGLFLQRRLTDYALHPRNAMYFLMGGQEPFDVWARSKTQGVEHRRGTELQGSPEVLWLLAELRKMGSSDSIQGAVCLLLGHSREWAVLADGIRRAQQGKKAPGQWHQISLQWRDMTIHLLVRPDAAPLQVGVRDQVTASVAGRAAAQHLFVVFERTALSSGLQVVEVHFGSKGR